MSAYIQNTDGRKAMYESKYKIGDILKESCTLRVIVGKPSEKLYTIRYYSIDANRFIVQNVLCVWALDNRGLRIIDNPAEKAYWLLRIEGMDG